jgi:HK97 family phage portal protein
MRGRPLAWFDRFRLGRKSSAVTTLDIVRELYAAGRMSASGKTVTLDSALRVATSFACGRLIGNGIAQVPLKLMRLSPDGKSRLPATDHPLYDVMCRRPNPWQTSFDFRTTMSWHLEFAGRFLAFKNAPAGTVRELIPLQPGLTRVKREADMSIRYWYRNEIGGEEREIPAEAIWHVRGPSWNGWDGMDTLSVARDALGLSMAIEDSQSSLHKNGVRPSGVYSVEGKLDAGQYDALAAWLKKAHAGAENDGMPMIVDRAAKWMSTAMTGIDAQTHETRMAQIAEVCRYFGVMPIMVGYSDKAATYASAEQMFLAHAVHCLSPRWTMYEQSMDAFLLTERERAQGYYFDFVEEGMIRGAAKDTKDVLLGYVNGGLMTPNEGREKLDLNPDSDPDSNKLRIPVNTVQDPSAVEKPAPA